MFLFQSEINLTKQKITIQKNYAMKPSYASGSVENVEKHPLRHKGGVFT